LPPTRFEPVQPNVIDKIKPASLVQIEEEKTVEDDVLSVAPEPDKGRGSPRSNLHLEIVQDNQIKAAAELEESQNTEFRAAKEPTIQGSLAERRPSKGSVDQESNRSQEGEQDNLDSGE